MRGSCLAGPGTPLGARCESSPVFVDVLESSKELTQAGATLEKKARAKLVFPNLTELTKSSDWPIICALRMKHGYCIFPDPVPNITGAGMHALSTGFITIIIRCAYP